MLFSVILIPSLVSWFMRKKSPARRCSDVSDVLVALRYFVSMLACHFSLSLSLPYTHTHTRTHSPLSIAHWLPLPIGLGRSSRAHRRVLRAVAGGRHRQGGPRRGCVCDRPFRPFVTESLYWLDLKVVSFHSMHTRGFRLHRSDIKRAS